MNGAARSYVVALTGGVAAGKSTVAQRFAALGVPIHDADVAAREVIEPGSEGLAAIVTALGADVLAADGTLDRAAMRKRIFADASTRTTLENIIHPRVRTWLHTRAMADTAPYCLLAIPLLVRSIDHYRWVDRVLLVDAPETAQLDRLTQRDGIDLLLAQRMLAQQASRAERRAIADDVIDNSGDAAALDAAVAALHQRYLELAAAR